MNCPVCDSPYLYTEGERRVFEVWCPRCFYNLNSSERRMYFKYLRNNNLEIVRPPNYLLEEGELDLIRIENSKHSQKMHQSKWREEHPEKHEENKVKIRSINYHRYHNNDNYRQTELSRRKKTRKKNKERYSPSTLI